MVASSKPYLSPEQYLELEGSSSVKHEYINGEIFAMAGATDAHVTITGNLFAALLGHLRGSGCRVYFSDMKARIDSLNRYYYPDIMVTCDQRDQRQATYKNHPKLIVEVLSDSTANFDRGDKFADYQQLESIEEYVLINTHRQRVECFRRDMQDSDKDADTELWTLQSYLPLNTVFELQSIGFTGSLAELYENVELN